MANSSGGGGRPETIRQLVARLTEGARQGLRAFVLVTRVERPQERGGFPWTRAVLMDMVAAQRERELEEALLLPEIRNDADYTDQWRQQGVVVGAVLQVAGAEAQVYKNKHAAPQGAIAQVVAGTPHNVIKMGVGVSVVDPCAIVTKVYSRLSMVACECAGVHVALVGGVLAAYEARGCVLRGFRCCFSA